MMKLRITYMVGHFSSSANTSSSRTNLVQEDEVEEVLTHAT
jgi:hypothetical protein